MLLFLSLLFLIKLILLYVTFLVESRGIGGVLIQHGRDPTLGSWAQAGGRYEVGASQLTAALPGTSVPTQGIK